MSADTHISFVASELARWDGIAAEALAVPLFEDERPLRGTAGLVDWRLCGRVSRWLQAGRLSGRLGEAMLFPPGRRLTFQRLLFYGCGQERELDEARFRTALRHARGTLRKIGVRRTALALPGRAGDRVAPRRALELVLDEIEADRSAGDLILVESAAGQREMADLLRSLRLSGPRPELS